MFKTKDYIIISLIAIFLGIFLVMQFHSAKEYIEVIRPENNEVIAVEVASLTKANAGLRQEVVDLTNSLNLYSAARESSQKTQEIYFNDIERYMLINGQKDAKGQGVVINIDGSLNTAQIVDLINAIKNIGGEIIAIDDERLATNTFLAKYSGRNKYKIMVLGNSNLLKSSLERKGGIVEQISSKDIQFSIFEEYDLEILAKEAIKFDYARVVN